MRRNYAKPLRFAFSRLAVLWIAALLAAAQLAAAADVRLIGSEPSPQLLGTKIMWVASLKGEPAGAVWYRFRVREAGAEFRMIRDFSPQNTLEWAYAGHEGFFEIEVTARDSSDGRISIATGEMQLTPRVSGATPVVSGTSHPLVGLYSAPACPSGSKMRVIAESSGVAAMTTPYSACDGAHTMNFYVAGLKPGAAYTLRGEIQSESGARSLDAIAYSPGTASPVQAPAAKVTTARKGPPAVEQIVLHAPIFPNRQIATDLDGNLVWYYPGDVSFVTRAAHGGRFLAVINGPGDGTVQRLREFDLAGITLKETSAARVNEQLMAAGKRLINAFHHEVRRLPDGKILALAGVEQMIQFPGASAAVDVLGDMIIVLDRDLNVVWTWDSFDFLDINRRALGGEKCSLGGCPPLFLAKDAEDWTHGNSVHLASDGSLLFSARHQDWVIKIDYANGAGSGDIIWRLGKEGDFRIDSPDPWPWFSHQHDAQLLGADAGAVLLFDNGNMRRTATGAGNSRGQLLILDEANRVARLDLNADLGFYSFALGSAQKLANGTYHFNNGWSGENSSSAVEVDATGAIVYTLELAQVEYRSFRMRDLYGSEP